MANSLLIKSPTATSAARPKLTRDPLIRPGGKVTFDFTDPRCHPNGVITPGAVAIGTTFVSLDETPVPAVAVSTGLTVNADGSIAFAGGGNASGANTGLRIGVDKQFDMSAAEYDRLMWLWLKLPTSGYKTTNYIPVMQITVTDANKSQGTLDLGIGGLRPRFAAAVPAGGGNTATGAAAADITTGIVHQITGRFDPTQPVQCFLDGAAFTQQNQSNADVYPPASGETQYLSIPNAAAMTIYRLGVCDLDASIAAETAFGFVAADILTAAQHVAADYAFGTGALAGAPKTAFA
jgi:hypothetical protein